MVSLSRPPFKHKPMKPFLEISHSAIQEACQAESDIFNRLHAQDTISRLAWNFCQTLNPDNPVQAAQLILANVERLKHVLKSYEDGTAITCDSVNGQNVVVVGEVSIIHLK